MLPQCRASGCRTTVTSRYSRYCARHKANLRRHGDPRQKAVTKTALKPYLKRIRARIEKNAENTAWATLDARWVALTNHARGILGRYEAGRANSRHDRAAAQEVLKLAANVEPRAVVETTMAMVMMWEFEPRRFLSDEAFWVQLSRRVRALTDVNYGERYDNATGRVKRAYRELSPRAAVTLGHWLAETLGIGGLHLAKLERAEMEAKAREKRELHDALNKLV